MKDVIKFLLIPIVGSIGIALMFILVVWAGNFQPKIENQQGKFDTASKDIGGYAVLGVTSECDNSYFPVCGFDGITYGNTCKAIANNTKVEYRGVCQN